MSERLCIGCGETRTESFPGLDGYHYDCKPCRGCGKAIEGQGLKYDGYHVFCKPCLGCGKTINGTGLLDNGKHYDCCTEEELKDPYLFIDARQRLLNIMECYEFMFMEQRSRPNEKQQSGSDEQNDVEPHISVKQQVEQQNDMDGEELEMVII